MATMVSFHSFFSISLAISIIFVSRFSITEANNGGFTVDLIHRDSPKSPFHNPSLTPSQCLNNALQRSFSRVHHLMSFSTQSASANVIPNGGEYIMKISMGTPPVQIPVIVDTGSDLIWTQCKPCIRCYNQKPSLFSPNSSSSYKVVPCSSKQCLSFPRTSCLPTTNTCQYSVSYGDKSFSHGDLATETVKLGSTTLRDMIFGCGHDNGGTFSDAGAGIVGLGGGQVSLISQMGSSIAGKFSYCLVPMSAQNTKASKMNFGGSGVVSGRGVVSTPIVSKSPYSFYFLTLEGISVANKRLDFYTSSASSNTSKLAQAGNIVIDSGSTLTLLPPDLYNRLVSAVKSTIKARPVKDPKLILSLCYSKLNVSSIPIITVHFRGGDLKLNPLNTFVRTSLFSICLGFAPAGEIAIYGNLAQMNFYVGYDLKKKMITFKPMDCTKQ
ncbi:unnamed protein product [Ilex paraguariensis]|uniref:Peptidase A1 domain-containing protein n=1 Tax=Ilex paraguariensis TaxID=185542 RepID=A0ABC8UW00_9AQUA